jgi:hypothetical protein
MSGVSVVCRIGSRKRRSSSARTVVAGVWIERCHRNLRIPTFLLFVGHGQGGLVGQRIFDTEFDAVLELVWYIYGIRNIQEVFLAYQIPITLASIQLLFTKYGPSPLHLLL